MRFRIEVSTLDGKLSYERDAPSEALDVAEGAKDSLGVSIVDSETGEAFTAEQFKKRFAS